MGSSIPGEKTLRCERLLSLLLLLPLGCTTAVPSAPTKEKAVPADVSVVRPQRKSLVRRVEQPGTILPLEEAHLFARVPGNVAASTRTSASGSRRGSSSPSYRSPNWTRNRPSNSP